jgi:DNA-directed RNA polymerase subunit RPC12/RpoP
MTFIPLRAYDNYIRATIELSLLQDEGIFCHLKDEYIITIDPFLSPALGGIKLMVIEGQVLMAEKILSDTEELYLKTVPCPNCEHNTLQNICETITPRSWTGKLRSMLINGQEQEVKHFYRCKNCHRSFKELPQTI